MSSKCLFASLMSHSMNIVILFMFIIYYLYAIYIDYAMLSCVICILRLLIVYEDNYIYVRSIFWLK